MKRLVWPVLGLVGLVALAAVGFFLLERPIGEALFRRAISEGVGRNLAAQLPDGLHVFLCGSGSPMPDPVRAGPCVGVVAGTHAFVFDVGSGSVRRLARMGFPIGQLERIYLTHLHSDHLDGLGELLLQAWVGGPRGTPLPVAGPHGIDEVVAGFRQAYRVDSTFRNAHHGPNVADLAGYGGLAEEIDVPREAGRLQVLAEDGLTVTAFLVDHEPVEPAFGYRIDYKGRSVTLSGDTVYSPNLVAVATGTDVLFHEALRGEMVSAMSEAAASAGRASTARIMADILSYHASPEDAARAAADAKARLLVLYHLVPPLPSRLLNAAFLGDAPKRFDGPIIVGEDGLLVSLPAGGTQIRHEVVK